jgi:hypothetical protein
VKIFNSAVVALISGLLMGSAFVPPRAALAKDRRTSWATRKGAS